MPADPAPPFPAPRVGVGVFVLRAGRVLLGERLGAHGAGTWAPPGGHLEFGESLHDCAVREVAEETGLVLTRTWPGPYTNSVFEAERKHYVTLLLLAECAPGEPVAREPDKCAAWRWFSWDALPAPLFLPLQTLVDSGYHPALPGPGG